MKLRVQGNSLRLRLSRSEVRRVALGETVSEKTNFPGGGGLRYELGVDHAATDLTVRFDKDCLTVTLPAQAAERWASTDTVDISSTITLDDGNTLSVLVEKDFQCLDHAAAEGQGDMFPHPGGACKT